MTVEEYSAQETLHKLLPNLEFGADTIKLDRKGSSCSFAAHRRPEAPAGNAFVSQEALDTYSILPQLLQAKVCPAMS